MIPKANFSTSNNCPIAISIGDPAGIGPEIIVKSWLKRNELALPVFFILGSADILQKIDPSLSIKCISQPSEASEHFNNALPVIDISAESSAEMTIEAIENGAKYVKLGEASALVTAPINKHTLYKAGFKHKGHTDFLAHLAGQDESDAVMMLHSDKLSIVPLTIHIPLKDVAKSITQTLIIKTAKTILKDLAERFLYSNPRIAITGLNPHAGENGSMGDEEENIIIPAIKQLQDQGHSVFGPYAADSLLSEGERVKYDAVLAMYHDQALAPFKALDMRNGVNITLGLDGLLRTSPDHGTAYEIAGQNMADPNSFIQAIIMAKRLSNSHE